MKKYILENVVPFLFGVVITLITLHIYNTVMDLLAKIAILKYK